MTDHPKSLKDKEEREARMQMLKQKHILPLTQFVEKIRLTEGPSRYVPYFDPLDGGNEAQCLFVLEAPGRMTIEPNSGKKTGSGFVSRNNNDETAKNFYLYNEKAEISRKNTIIWNIVPWYIDKKERDIQSSDIREGLLYLYQLIEILTNLKAIVLVGGNAKKVTKPLSIHNGDVIIFPCYHPSPMFVNRHGDNKQKIIDQLRAVSVFLDGLTKNI